MLVPITRQKFEQLIPLIATGPQYAYFWGKFSNLLKRILISVISVVVVLILKAFFGSSFDGIGLLLGIIGSLYWLWGPIYWATLRNIEMRRYQYCGFWRGRVLDVFITEELIGKEESVNNRGELVIAENRERRLNIEVGDQTGFTCQLQAPLSRLHKGINRGQVAEMLLLSYQPDLETIANNTDIYIPSMNLWVSDYPYLQREVFVQVSRQLGKSGRADPPKRREQNKRRRR
jgi:hypothetical protein